MKDSKGNTIKEGDLVYIAGTGICEAKASLVFENSNGIRYPDEVYAEQDMGEIVGNINDNPGLLE